MPLPNILDAIMKRRPDGADPAQNVAFFPGGQPTNPANVMPAPQALPPVDPTIEPNAVPQQALTATPGGPAAILQASQAPPTAPSVQPEFYPNGVRKQAMDERTPDGKTVLEATQDAMNNGQADNTGSTPAAMPPSGSNIPDSPEYRQYQQAQADAAAPVAPPPGKTPAASTDPREKLRNLALNGAPPEKKWWKRMLQGALEGYAAGGLGGAAAGAALQTFVPSTNARSNTQRQIAQLEPRAQYLDAQDDAARKDQKAQIDMQTATLNNKEKLFKVMGDVVTNDPKWAIIKDKRKIEQKDADYLNAKSKALIGYDPQLTPEDWQTYKTQEINGQTVATSEIGKPNFFPTNAPINEVKQPVTAISPVTGTPVKVTGSDLLGSETTTALSNAGRQQSADEANAQRAFEAAKTNASAQANYNSQLVDLQKAALAPFAQLIGGSTELTNQASAINMLSQQASDAADRLNATPMTGVVGRENAQAAFDDAQKAFIAAQTKFSDTLGKTQGAAAAAAAFNSIKPKPPTMVKPTTIQSTQVGGRMSVSEPVFRQRLVANGIRDKARQDTIVEKAKTDGVIK